MYDGQTAGLIITTYNVPNCPIHAGQNVSYGMTYGFQALANTWSYTLSRDIQDGEQLDWSVYTPNQGNINGVPAACTQFAETTSPDPKDHSNLLGATCYGLGNQANVSFGSSDLSLENFILMAFIAVFAVLAPLNLYLIRIFHVGSLQNRGGYDAYE